MAKSEYTCHRCDGTGKIRGFSHVLGGVCFKCHGSGVQHTKPSARSAKWAVVGTNRLTGENVFCYWTNARTAGSWTHEE